MNKLPLIIKREYLAKVRNKSFVIMTFLSPILMVGMVVLIAYLTEINDNEKRIIGVFNESNYFSNDFNTTESTSYVQFKNITLQAAKDSTTKVGYYGLLHIPDETELEKVAKHSYFYTKEAPSTTVVDKLEEIFQDRLRERRLLDLGFVKGAEISIDLLSPLKNPTAYSIKGTSIALRKDQASKILIKKEI